jgi:hypothetical protein
MKHNINQHTKLILDGDFGFPKHPQPKLVDPNITKGIPPRNPLEFLENSSRITQENKQLKERIAEQDAQIAKLNMQIAALSMLLVSKNESN